MHGVKSLLILLSIAKQIAAEAPIEPAVISPSVEAPLKNSKKTCGQTTLNYRQTRIVGGDVAEERQLPFVVFLSLAYINPDDPDDDYFLSCGGSIISSSWILTAAHCVVNTLSIRNTQYRFRDWVAIAGVIDILNHEDGGILYDGKPKSVIRHPKYNKRHYNEYDAALLKVVNDIEFSEVILPICLPTRKDARRALRHRQVILAGWGYSNQLEVSDYLNKAMSFTLTPKACQRKFPWSTVSSKMFCTFSFDSNSCLGDSGGPVILINRQRKAFQLGIISFSVSPKNKKCLTGIPSVHTYLPAVLPWIRKIIKK